MFLTFLQYRKKVCAEFAFHFLSEVIAHLAFIIVQAPVCSGFNSDLYTMCTLEQSRRMRAIIYTTISLSCLTLVFVVSLFSIGKHARQSLRILFAPWQTFVNAYFPLLLAIATGTLVYPYQFALVINKMAHLP